MGFEFAGLTAAPNEGDGHDGEVQRMLSLAMELPETYREPLMLRAVRGLSSRQVGEILDLPIATVDTRVCRARRMLRELAEQERMGDEGSDPSGDGGPIDSRRRKDQVASLRLAASGDAR